MVTKYPDYPAPSEDHVALKDCWGMLGVSRSLVCSLEKSGKIKFYRLGSKIYIKRSELLKCMEST